MKTIILSIILSIFIAFDILYCQPVEYTKDYSTVTKSATKVFCGDFELYPTAVSTTTYFEIKRGTITKVGGIYNVPLLTGTNAVIQTSTITSLSNTSFTGTNASISNLTATNLANTNFTSAISTITTLFNPSFYGNTFYTHGADWFTFVDPYAAQRLQVGRFSPTRAGLDLISGSFYIGGTLRFTSAGVVRATAGTTAEPAYSFAADTNTGFANIGSNDNIQVILNGATFGTFTPTNFEVGTNRIDGYDISSQFLAIDTSTSTLSTRITDLAISTGALRTDIISVGITTGTLRTDLNAVALSTGTLVRKSGDTMTGQLTISGSSLTITGDAFSVGGSTFVVRGGRVGIGTITPLQALDVNGNIFLSAASAFINTAGTFELLRGGISRMSFYVGRSALRDQVGSEVITLTSSNVGIGTTTPTHRLSVVGGIVATSSITASSFFGDGSNLTGTVDVDCRVSTGTLVTLGTSQEISGAKTFTNDITITDINKGYVLYDIDYSTQAWRIRIKNGNIITERID